VRKDSITKLLVGLLLRGALCLAGASWAQDTPVYFAPDPGPAKAEIRANGFALWNGTLSIAALTSGGHVDEVQFQNLLGRGTSRNT
jgi:hypothetical protein